MTALHDVLAIRAGPRALERIRSHGLDPADIGIIPAAAGGPKGLALIGLDRAIFGEWLPRARRERWLIGASIGAWRMAAVTMPDPSRKLSLLAALYCDEQNYRAKPAPAEVSAICADIVARLIGDDAQALLENSNFRLAVLTVLGRGAVARDYPGSVFGWGLAATANTVARRHLAKFLHRGVFASDASRLPFFQKRFDAFSNEVVQLTSDNLRPALLASGSIPLLLAGVSDIPGAPSGTYWDGGIVDYHLALPYGEADGLVLYPHFADHIMPGWLDKFFPSRRATDAALANVVMVGPTREFMSKLPGGKLPDRSDFKRYGRDFKARSRIWRGAVAESERLGEAFMRWCEKPDPAMVRSFAERTN
jgi:hypothetical protein